MLAILVGLKGSGKTTVMKKVMERNPDIKQIIAGDYFAEYYKERDLSRDEGDLGVDSSEHFRIQREVFKKIRKEADKHDKVIVDTHAFLTKKEGYYPGLPLFVMKDLEPDTIIMMDYLPKDILKRRQKDKEDLGRDRSAALTLEGVKKEQRVQEEFVIAAAVAGGCTVKMIERYEKQEYPFQHAEQNADEIVELFE